MPRPEEKARDAPGRGWWPECGHGDPQPRRVRCGPPPPGWPALRSLDAKSHAEPPGGGRSHLPRQFAAFDQENDFSPYEMEMWHYKEGRCEGRVALKLVPLGAIWRAHWQSSSKRTGEGQRLKGQQRSRAETG